MLMQKVRVMTRGEYLKKNNIRNCSENCTRLFARGSIYDGRRKHYICIDFDNELHFSCIDCLKKPAIVAGKYIAVKE